MRTSSGPPRGQGHLVVFINSVVLSNGRMGRDCGGAGSNVKCRSEMTVTKLATVEPPANYLRSTTREDIGGRRDLGVEPASRLEHGSHANAPRELREYFSSHLRSQSVVALPLPLSAARAPSNSTIRFSRMKLTHEGSQADLRCGLYYASRIFLAATAGQRLL